MGGIREIEQRCPSVIRIQSISTTDIGSKIRQALLSWIEYYAYDLSRYIALSLLQWRRTNRGRSLLLLRSSHFSICTQDVEECIFHL
jgi:hypothetical protein